MINSFFLLSRRRNIDLVKLALFFLKPFLDGTVHLLRHIDILNGRFSYLINFIAVISPPVRTLHWTL